MTQPRRPLYCRSLRAAAIMAAWALTVLLPARDAAALGPHELLLLVNRNSFDSLTVANHYITLRGIPHANVVYLDIPEAALTPEAELTPEQFTRSIWNPALAAIEERGLGEHVTAWVFSAGFPVRVRTDPRMSVHGLLNARNEPPASEAIRTGTHASLLFRGPVAPGAPVGTSLTLETLNAALGERMPVPAMTLAHTGSLGLTRSAAVDLLRRSASADSVRPEGTVYFVLSDDVRTRAREWQFDPVIAELESLGVRAVRTDQFPAGAQDVAGLLAGTANPVPSRIGAFLPGAMAEHLTSYAAVFDNPGQTKATAWLQAGAASSAGTITEPMSIWTKFPAARFFAHYARGCTLLESFAQSLASPVQSLLLGDPLTAPWKPALSLDLGEVFDDPEGALSFQARLEPDLPADYLFFLNDQRVTPLLSEPKVRLDPGLSGHHTLRAVAYLRGTLRHQAFAVAEIERPAPGRIVRLSTTGDAAGHPRWMPLALRVEAEGNPRRIRILAHGRVIETVEGGGPADRAIEPAGIGAGPVQFHAVAEYTRGGEVRSRPLVVAILDEEPPAPEVSLRRGRDAREPFVQAETRGPGSDRWAWAWFAELWPRVAELPDTVRRTGDGAVSMEPADEPSLRLHPEGEDSPFLLLLTEAESPELEVLVQIEPGGRSPAGEAGLVCFAEGEDRFLFFGIDARRSAWVLSSHADGRARRLAAHGAPIESGAWHRLTVRRTAEGGVEAFANGVRVGHAPADRVPGGTLAGVRAQNTAARFRRPLYRLPDDGSEASPGSARLRAAALPETPLWLRGTLDTSAIHRNVRP